MIKVVIYDEKEQENKSFQDSIGTFYVPDDATKEWVEKNIPPIIRVAQLLAGKIKETGY